MVLLEPLVVILRLVRTYQLLVGSLVMVVKLQLVLAALVLVLWALQANQFHEMPQTPQYMVSLAAVMLAPRHKQVTLPGLVVVLAVEVLMLLVARAALLTKGVQAVVLAEAVVLEDLPLVARAVQMLETLLVGARLVRRQYRLQAREAQVVLVLSVKAVAVVVLAALRLVLGALAVRVVLVLAVVAAVRQMLDQIQALAVMVAMACAVSTLGKEQT